jgi:hypothetical protein
MSRRAAWIIGLVALAVGIGVGAAVTYLLVAPRRLEPRAAEERPTQREPARQEGAPSDAAPPPRLEPAEASAGAVLAACNLFPAMSYRVRGFNAAYYFVTESNSYTEGHSDIGSNYGMATDGQRMTVVLARQPPPGARELPGFLGVAGDGGSTGHAFRLPEEEFAAGRSTTAYWGVEKPLELRVGQSATLCQFGTCDLRTGHSSDRDLAFDRDPLADFKPLPRRGEGDNDVARVTVRVMRMDPGWTLDSPEVKQFLDFRTALRRAAGGGE